MGPGGDVVMGFQTCGVRVGGRELFGAGGICVGGTLLIGLLIRPAAYAASNKADSNIPPGNEA